MVVEYQSGGQQVTCKSFTQDKDLDVYWIDNNVKNRAASWLVDTYNRFDLKPYCEARSKHDNLTCGKQLDLIVYSRFCLSALCGYLMFILTIHSLR